MHGKGRKRGVQSPALNVSSPLRQILFKHVFVPVELCARRLKSRKKQRFRYFLWSRSGGKRVLKMMFRAVLTSKDGCHRQSNQFFCFGIQNRLLPGQIRKMLIAVPQRRLFQILGSFLTHRFPPLVISFLHIFARILCLSIRKSRPSENRAIPLCPVRPDFEFPFCRRGRSSGV